MVSGFASKKMESKYQFFFWLLRLKVARVSKVLAKEVAAFNIRVLIVSLGAFNTNMGNAITVGKNHLQRTTKPL